MRCVISDIKNTLASVKFAVAIVLIITAVCIFGTIVPQGFDAIKAAEKNPTFGRWLTLFQFLGVTNVFYAWWFIGLLGLLASSIAMCSSRRFLTVKRSEGFIRRKAIGSMLTHLSFLLILAGGMVRGIWGTKGQLELHEGDNKDKIETARGVAGLPFAVRLEKFQLLRDEPAPANPGVSAEEKHEVLVQWEEKQLAARVATKPGEWQTLTNPDSGGQTENNIQFRIVRFVPDFVIDSQTKQIISRSTAPNNPAVLVESKGPDFGNTQWLFAKYPDYALQSEHGKGTDPHRMPLRMVYVYTGSNEAIAGAGAIKNYRSSLKFTSPKDAGTTATVEVNSPFKYGGYTFYQSGYNPEHLCWTSLQVVRDPGVPLVYTGFALMLGGLFLIFYLNPWIESRKPTV